MHSESQVREMTRVFCFHLLDYFTGCSLRELWNLSAAGVTLLSNVSSLGDSAAQYPSCNVGSVGSVVLRDNRLNTATVAYYSGTTPGSRACFVCDESSGHVLNTTITERVCQNDATWSGSSIICGTLCYMVIGASLSEPYTSVTALHMRVSIHISVYGPTTYRKF